MIALWPDSYLAPGPLRGAEASRNCGEEPSIAITISITSITIATIIIIISHIIIIIIIISFTSITIIDRNYDDVLYVLGALVPKRCLRRSYCVAYCAVYSHAPQTPMNDDMYIYIYIYIYIIQLAIAL